MGKYSEQRKALLEKAALAAVPKAPRRMESYADPVDEFADHIGLGPKRPTMPGASQEEVDNKAWPDDKVGFIHQPNGQMYMTEGTDIPYKLPKTFTNEDGIHEYGEESEPYAQRPTPQGKQLPLGRADAFRPNDPALHNLRQQNPHLNDYEFHLIGSQHPNQIHTVTAIHKPSGSQAGSMSWKGSGYAEAMHPGEGRAGEVEMVSVYDQHAGKGISTAMWDYAHFHATRDGSPMAAPMHSDNRSVEGNHWAHFVGGASMARVKGHNVKRY